MQFVLWPFSWWLKSVAISDIIQKLANRSFGLRHHTDIIVIAAAPDVVIHLFLGRTNIRYMPFFLRYCVFTLKVGK